MKLHVPSLSPSSLAGRRAVECLAIGMIGDGALAFFEPNRHIELWARGPRTWEKMIHPFEVRPRLTRWFGAAEFALGIWLASRQHV